jgi:hypothetical protein
LTPDLPEPTEPAPRARTFDLDRFFAGIDEAHNIINALREAGVEIRYLDRTFTERPNGKLRPAHLTIEQRDQIAELLRRGPERLAHLGEDVAGMVKTLLKSTRVEKGRASR